MCVWGGGGGGVARWGQEEGNFRDISRIIFSGVHAYQDLLHWLFLSEA